MATITCVHCGRNEEQMQDPPMGGQLGETLQNKICPACWNEWQGQQVLYINHYGLQLADPDDRKKLIQVMKEYLGIDQA